MSNKVYFKNLDGLRTIACLMVFFWHAVSIGHIAENLSGTVISNALMSYLGGKNGVSIFFVLSGFLITWLLLKEVKETGTLKLGKFYMRRVLRIWPLYFAVLLVVFVILPLVNYYYPILRADTDMNPVMYFTFLSNFDVLRIVEAGTTDFLPSTITWSVAIEEQFYLFWPLLFLLIPFKYIQYALVGVLAAALLFRIINADHYFQLYYHSFSAAFDLATGGVAAWLMLHNARLREVITSAGNKARLLIFVLGLVTMYASIALPAGILQIIVTVFQSFFFAWIIADQSFNTSNSGKLGKIGWLTNLGKYTYGIYMIHPLVLHGIKTVCIRVFGWGIFDYQTLVAGAVIGLPLTLVAAWLSYHYMEKWFLQLKSKFATSPVTDNNNQMQLAVVPADSTQTPQQ